MRILGTLLLLAAVAAAGDTITLKNGVRVILLPQEDCADASILTVLPFGLASDPKGCAQWSHLVEHCVVTSTGPAPFSEVNAETMADCMHFDWTRPATRLQEGLETVARWLTLAKFDEAAVTREKGRVVAEVEGIAARGRTGKFALAAWAQAVRFGATRVDIDAGLASVRPKALAAYWQEARFGGGPPVIAICGGFDRDAVLKTLHSSIEKLAVPDEGSAAAGKAKAPDRVTWDLPTRHAVFYWELPQLSAGDRSALRVAQQAAFTAFAGGAAVPTVESCVRCGGKRYFVVALRRKEKDSLDAAQAKAKEFVGALLAEKSSSRSVAHLQVAFSLARLASPPAFDATPRARANGALQRALFLLRAGEEPAAAARRISGTKDAGLRTALARLLPLDGMRALEIAPSH